MMTVTVDFEDRFNGSLGWRYTRCMNHISDRTVDTDTVDQHLNRFYWSDVQLLWLCGKACIVKASCRIHGLLHIPRRYFGA